jgi:hypothetical protein
MESREDEIPVELIEKTIRLCGQVDILFLLPQSGPERQTNLKKLDQLLKLKCASSGKAVNTIIVIDVAPALGDLTDIQQAMALDIRDEIHDWGTLKEFGGALVAVAGDHPWAWVWDKEQEVYYYEEKFFTKNYAAYLFRPTQTVAADNRIYAYVTSDLAAAAHKLQEPQVRGNVKEYNEGLQLEKTPRYVVEGLRKNIGHLRKVLSENGIKSESESTVTGMQRIITKPLGERAQATFLEIVQKFEATTFSYRLYAYSLLENEKIGYATIHEKTSDFSSLKRCTASLAARLCFPISPNRIALVGKITVEEVRQILVAHPKISFKLDGSMVRKYNNTPVRYSAQSTKDKFDGFAVNIRYAMQTGEIIAALSTEGLVDVKVVPVASLKSQPFRWSAGLICGGDNIKLAKVCEVLKELNIQAGPADEILRKYESGESRVPIQYKPIKMDIRALKEVEVAKPNSPPAKGVTDESQTCPGNQLPVVSRTPYTKETVTHPVISEVKYETLNPRAPGSKLS